MEFTLDYASLAKTLECQELESPNGRASAPVYGQLLAIYLLFNDLTSAKFLWKRIPDEVKAGNAELSVIWSVGVLMWKKNYSEIYKTIDSYPVWPNHLKKIMKLTSESTRQRVIELISRAYSSIALNDASKLLGLTNEETINLAPNQNWTYDAVTGFLTIDRSDSKGVQHGNKNKAGGQAILGLDNGTELLEKLTDYILFLESNR